MYRSTELIQDLNFYVVKFWVCEESLSFKLLFLLGYIHIHLQLQVINISHGGEEHQLTLQVQYLESQEVSVSC